MLYGTMHERNDKLTEKLVSIEKNDWIELRNLYRSDWQKNILTYYTIDNFIRWVQLEPDYKHLQIYSLNDDWRHDGTFIIIVSWWKWNENELLNTENF